MKSLQNHLGTSKMSHDIILSIQEWFWNDLAPVKTLYMKSAYPWGRSLKDETNAMRNMGVLIYKHPHVTFLEITPTWVNRFLSNFYQTSKMIMRGCECMWVRVQAIANGPKPDFSEVTSIYSYFHCHRYTKFKAISPSYNWKQMVKILMDIMCVVYGSHKRWIPSRIAKIKIWKTHGIGIVL